MSYCSHSSGQPIPEITPCEFEHRPEIVETFGADILCGVLNVVRKKVAVKAFRPIERNSEDAIENEMKIWGLLGNHPHIASLIGTAPVSSYHPKYLPKGPVSDYYTHGNLMMYLNKTDEGVANHHARFKLLLGVIQGLTYIHEQSIIHGDLKAVNVLVDGDGEVARICDFGSSRIECRCYSGPCEQEGTILWDSPELYLEVETEEEPSRTQHSDVWAFGCVALEVQMGLLPWDPLDERIGRAMRRRQEKAGKGPPANASDPKLSLEADPLKQRVWSLMEWCWSADPRGRPSAAELLDKMLNITQSLPELTTSI